MTDPQPPQIAFINGDNWGIISRLHRDTGIGLSKMPEVSCPIVGTSQISPQEKANVLRKYVTPHGVTSVPILLATLIGAGGAVLNKERNANNA